MKGINREKHIQVRFTEPELVKFKQVAKENGLTLSGFARCSMARASIIYSNKTRTVMEKRTLSLSQKRKQELIEIAHQKGMVLNQSLNILLLNKIL